jgi:hypothetical protein
MGKFFGHTADARRGGDRTLSLPFSKRALFRLSYVPIYGGSNYFLRDFFLVGFVIEDFGTDSTVLRAALN